MPITDNNGRCNNNHQRSPASGGGGATTSSKGAGVAVLNQPDDQSHQLGVIHEDKHDGVSSMSVEPEGSGEGKDKKGRKKRPSGGNGKNKSKNKKDTIASPMADQSDVRFIVGGDGNNSQDSDVETSLSRSNKSPTSVNNQLLHPTNMSAASNSTSTAVATDVGIVVNGVIPTGVIYGSGNHIPTVMVSPPITPTTTYKSNHHHHHHLSHATRPPVSRKSSSLDLTTGGGGGVGSTAESHRRTGSVVSTSASVGSGLDDDDQIDPNRDVGIAVEITDGVFAWEPDTSEALLTDINLRADAGNVHHSLFIIP